MFRAVKDAHDQILDGGRGDRTSRGRNGGPERREAARPQGAGAPDQRGWVPSTIEDDLKLVEELCARIMAGALSGLLTLWGWTAWEVGEAWAAATAGLLPGSGEAWNLAAAGASLIVAIVFMTVQNRIEDPGVHAGSPLGRVAVTDDQVEQVVVTTLEATPPGATARPSAAHPPPADHPVVDEISRHRFRKRHFLAIDNR